MYFYWCCLYLKQTTITTKRSLASDVSHAYLRVCVCVCVAFPWAPRPNKWMSLLKRKAKCDAAAQGLLETVKYMSVGLYACAFLGILQELVCLVLMCSMNVKKVNTLFSSLFGRYLWTVKTSSGKGGIGNVDFYSLYIYAPETRIKLGPVIKERWVWL